MAFEEVIQEHWDQIHVLGQICIIIGQATMNEQHIHLDFTMDSSNQQIRSDQNQNESYNIRLMYKIADRIMDLGSDLEHLSPMQTTFGWISAQNHRHIDKLKSYSLKIFAICDKLMSEMKHTNLNEMEDLMQIQELISIEKFRLKVYRDLATALDEDPTNQTELLQNASENIEKCIEICSKNNYCIKIFNDKLCNIEKEMSDKTSEQKPAFELIRNGELKSQQSYDMTSLFQIATNICQKMNSFEKSLDFISKGIAFFKQRLTTQYTDRIEFIANPRFENDDSDDDDDDHGNNDNMDVDGDDDFSAKLKECDDTEFKFNSKPEIKRYIEIANIKWTKMDKKEKLDFFIFQKMFHLIISRELAYSNLEQSEKAFADAYLATLIKPYSITAWNNRAFAWYQLGKYEFCIRDCNYSLKKFVKKLSKFSRGLLIGNRGLSEYKLGLYFQAIDDLNECIVYAPNSRLARECLHNIWEEFVAAIYEGCQPYSECEIPNEVAKIIADYGVGIDYNLLPQCHESTIVYQN